MYRLRYYFSTLIGAALLLIAADLFIVFYRWIGLTRDSAIYAGVCTLSLFATLMARHWFKPRTSQGDTHDA